MDVETCDAFYTTQRKLLMKFTHRRWPHRPSKFPFFMICLGITFLAWIGMAEPELGISTVHWIGPQSVFTAANHAADQAPQQPPAPAGAASDKAAPVAQPELVPPQPPLSLFNDAAGRPDPNGVMWIDPLQLVHRFPEKYGGCFFGKGANDKASSVAAPAPFADIDPGVHPVTPAGDDCEAGGGLDGLPAGVGGCVQCLTRSVVVIVGKHTVGNGS